MQQSDERADHTKPLLEGVRNFRDIGGLPAADGMRVRHGRYFRSGHLASPTDADCVALRALGVRLVVDLRSPADIDADGADVLPQGARWVHLPMSDPARHSDFWRDMRDGDMAVLRDRLGGGRAERIIAGDYRDQVVRRCEQHARLLRALVEVEGLPAVVHCSAGKDRAGIAAALVQRILGVPDAAIVENYLASNAPEARYVPARGSLADNPELHELFEPFLTVRADYLCGALEVMDTHWGGFDAYLTRALGVTAADRQRLCMALLEDH